MQKSIVLYCDILGFRELISSANKEQVLAHIQKALTTSVGIIGGMKNQFEKSISPEDYPIIGYKLFSDNLYVSVSVKSEESFDFAFFVSIVLSRLFQEAMLMHNYLIRGAIVYDEDYYDDNIIFSPALVSAYELESKKANYPRIIVDQKLIDKLDRISFLKDFEFFFNKSLIIDWSKTIFLNPVGVLQQFFHGTRENPIDQLILDTGTHKNLIAEYDKMKTGNKLREAEKILWLTKVIEWLISLQTDPTKPANSLGLSFIKFVPAV